MAPASGPVETPRMVPGWDAEVLGDLPQEVALTIASAWAPSTRRAYTLKWNLFVKWCSSHQEDSRRCLIRAVLSFLQQELERRLSPSTLKVYVAAISTPYDPVEGKSVGKHNLVVRFLMVLFHCMVRYGSARLGTVRLSSGRFAFPLQFSTAIEWAGLFTRRYNCAASSAVKSS